MYIYIYICIVILFSDSRSFGTRLEFNLKDEFESKKNTILFEQYLQKGHCSTHPYGIQIFAHQCKFATNSTQIAGDPDVRICGHGRTWSSRGFCQGRKRQNLRPSDLAWVAGSHRRKPLSSTEVSSAYEVKTVRATQLRRSAEPQNYWLRAL